MNFEAELNNLLEAEEIFPLSPLEEIARAQLDLLEGVRKHSANVSLQVEEIYDIVKESDDNARELKSAARRENQLLTGLVAIDDLLDSLLRYLRSSDLGDTEMIAAQRESALNRCGIELLGVLGERLDPRIHTVANAEHDDAPLETVIRILENGFAYRGKIFRKASVIISMGGENA